MRNKFLASLLVVSICTSTWTSEVVLATPNSSAEETIKNSKVKYQELDDKILGLSSQIDKLNSEISELNTKLENNKEEKKLTEDQIKSINLELTQAKEEIKKTQNILDGRLRAMYKSNMFSDVLSYALASENVFDLLSRIQHMSRIISLDKDLIKEINEKTEFLNKSAETLKEKRESLSTLEESLNKNLSDLNSKQEDQEQKLAKFNEEKAEAFAVIEENEKTLISHSLSVINSGSSSKSELENAISTLKGLLPQLNSDNVKELANDGISSANSQIEDIKAAESIKNTAPLPENNKPTDGKYKATYTMEATAYSNHGTTAMGPKPVRDPNGLSTIAVDPKVIPLGTKVYIPGYGYAVALDTGGAIKGNIIDLYMNSEAECYSWGRRNVTLHVVAYPGEW